MLTRWEPFRDPMGIEAEFDRLVGPRTIEVTST
jgi:hypothetical protein